MKKLKVSVIEHFVIALRLLDLPNFSPAYIMAFQQFDKSQDGFINAEELGQLLRTLGENPTEQELTDLICEADKDGSGQVDLVEFIWLMNTREKRARCADEMKLAFKMFDVDNDGLVTASDFRRVIESMGESFTNREIDMMITKGDEDKDGMLAYMGNNNNFFSLLGFF